MYKNLKTSTQISIKFTIFTTLLVLSFWILANLIFFFNWFFFEKNRLKMFDEKKFNNEIIKNFENLLNNEKKWKGPNFEMQKIKIYSINDNEAQILLNSTIFDTISKFDNEYYMYNISDWKIFVSFISPPIDMQINLILITIVLTILLSFLSNFLSKIFVKSSLKKLNNLNAFLENLNIENLDKKIQYEWPIDDEINKLIIKFNEALEKINLQSISLKDFIKNASHEIKTPLMTISSEIDLTKKTKNYESWLDNIKYQLKTINNLLDILLEITKIETSIKLSIVNINISDETLNILENITKIYNSKNINIKNNITKNIFLKTNQQWRNLIIKNILDNAFKFADKNWCITINLNNKEICIEDNWIWINKQNLEKIWERFWQEDISNTNVKSFWLWLYLTKLTCDKLWFKINVESDLWKWTKFTIIFK